MVRYTKFRDDRQIRSQVTLGKPEGVHQPPPPPVPARVKERDEAGSGRAGPRILRFSLKFERTRCARCARSLVIR